MARKRIEVVSSLAAEKYIDGVRAIMACLQDNAPHDHRGEMMLPYRNWFKEIEEDLKKWEKWVGPAAGQEKSHDV